MTDINDCPNCNTKLKSAMFGSVILLKDSKVKLINEYHNPKANGYCSKCGPALHEKAIAAETAEEDSINKIVAKYISVVPVLTLQNPQNWEYNVLGMVTAQSTTGTGIFSEFASSFTDLMGRQSTRYNQKLKGGENLCFTQLRKAALDLGGNAIIATDIDYAEVGGDKGMLMVCMAGTAIKLNNLSLLSENVVAQMTELTKANDRLRYLSRLDTSGVYN